MLNELRINKRLLDMAIPPQAKEHMQWRQVFEPVDYSMLIDIEGQEGDYELRPSGAETPPVQRCLRAGLMEHSEGRDGAAREWLEL